MNAFSSRRLVPCLVLVFIFFAGGLPVSAASFSETIRGRILLDVQSRGEAWYVYPDTLTRHYLAQKEDAYSIMRSLGLGITNADLEKIPVAVSQVSGGDSDGDGLADPLEIGLGTDPFRTDSDGDGYADAVEISNNFHPLGAGTRMIDHGLLKRLAGKILLQVEGHGEAWYVHPTDLRRYYLGQPEDAYTLMRFLSLGITSSDLSRVSISDTSLPPPPVVSEAASSVANPSLDADGVTFEKTQVTVDGQTFSVSIMRLDRERISLVTHTANASDCLADCPAKTLKQHIEEAGAIAGVNGSYFCPPDYGACSTRINSYDPPFFHSGLDLMLNEEKIKFHNRPMVGATSSGDVVYFHRPDAFGNSVAAFEETYQTTLTAGFGSWPSLIEEGVNVFANEPFEAPWANKGRRGAFGWNENEFIVVITDSATMANSARVMETFGVTYAVNIDGGGSSALYAEGGYKIGPGRLLPNAILFRAK